MEIKITVNKIKEGFYNKGITTSLKNNPMENFLPMLELIYRELESEEIRRICQ